jgi:hypothetical protein
MKKKKKRDVKKKPDAWSDVKWSDLAPDLQRRFAQFKHLPDAAAVIKSRFDRFDRYLDAWTKAAVKELRKSAPPSPRSTTRAKKKRRKEAS